MRASRRPSDSIPEGDDNEYVADREEVKLQNIQRYSERARAGLPLFETMQVIGLQDKRNALVGELAVCDRHLVAEMFS